MPMGYEYTVLRMMREHRPWVRISYLREASASLVLTVRAMRRPPKVGRATKYRPHAFFCNQAVAADFRALSWTNRLCRKYHIMNIRRLLAIVLFCALCVLTPSTLKAQNANRSGFFLEAAVGGTIGDTPRVAATFSENHDFSFTYAGGTAWNFAFGQRFRTSNHFAYEVKAEVQSTVSNILPAAVCKFYPLGLRYTSPEVWRNFSIYATGSLGGAIGSAGNYLKDVYYDSPLISGQTKDIKFFDEVSGGAAYSVGLGVNITSHFYAGFLWDGQFMFNQYRFDKGNRNWGMVGFKLGYKF